MSTNKRFQILCLALLLICGACATLDQEPEARYSPEQLKQMGEKFLAAGDISQALKFLTWGEKKRPNDPVIHYDLGLAYSSRGLPAEAALHFEKAISLKPNYSEAYNAMGALCAERGQADKAEQYFQKALANPIYDTPHFVMFNLGRLYEKKGEYDLALRQYQEAVRLQPNYGLAYYRMGQVLESMRRADEAREAYGKAIQYYPDLAEAHFRYGVMSYTSGELEHALYSLSRVIKLSPHSNMASESKKYLERLQSIIGGEPAKTSGIPASEKLARLEVMTEQEMLSHESEAAAASESASADAPKESEQDQKTPSKPTVPKKNQKTAPKSSHQDSQWTYIVQVGSFLVKENAESLQRQLKEKGYEVVLKSFNHQVLGPIHVVQLKPVNNASKASTLVSQVESEGQQVKPIIIKVPANF